MCTSPLCNTRQRLWLSAMALFFFVSLTTAQTSDKITSVTTGNPHEGEPVSIRADLSTSAGVDHLEIAYRLFGQQQFKHQEMVLTGTTASIDIPASEVSPPVLEYYLLIFTQGNATPETYPVENPEAHPLQVSILSANSGQEQIVILSPDANEPTTPEDFFISFSLANADSSVDKSVTKVYVDNADVSENMIVSDDLVTVPSSSWSSSLSAGNHALRIELYDNNKKLVHTSNTNFASVSNISTIDYTTGISSSGIISHASVQLETRHENVASSTTPYNRATMSANAMYGDFRVNGKLFVTNEETDYRQPQNRFFIGAESPWLKLGYGDHNPIFPSLIMNGRRVRGFTGNLMLGVFNVDISTGETVRPIESQAIKIFSKDSLTVEQQRDSLAPYAFFDSTVANGERWAKFQYGTFKRDLFVIRPSFGRNDQSHIGFTYLKSKDDVGSILYGVRPQENLVVGADMAIVLDNRRIQLSMQSAFSATNRDISRGTFTDEDIDSIFNSPSDDRDQIKSIKNFLSKFITVNENLIPLSLKNLTTVSHEVGLGLNYFNNNFKWAYIRHGNDYESFGQSYLRTDIAGFNFSDRQGLLENQLILSGGYERLTDNTAETKAATTVFTTVNASVSYYPRANFPSITLGYARAGNSNGINNNPPQYIDSVYAVEDNTDRILVQLGHSFTFGGRHSASLTVSTSSRDDQTLKNLDTKSTSVTLSNVTTYDIPLQTTVSLSVNANTFSLAGIGGTSSLSANYTTLYANAQYKMLEEKLRLSATLSPTFGDFKRTLMEMGAQYYFYKNLSGQTQLFLYFNSSGTNDTVFSFILRFDV